MKLRLTWPRYFHEHRNHYLQLGLNELAEEGALEYREVDIREAAELGFSREMIDHHFKHLSILVVEKGARRRVVMVDNNDSFIHLSPLIREADLYFSVPYAPEFHEGREFPTPYPWQSEEDLAYYRSETRRLVGELGDQFGKIRPLAPTPTAMESPKRDVAPSLAERASQRVRRTMMNREERNEEARQRRLLKARERYAQMLSYRDCSLKYDIVMRESAWGWPAHRVRLHRQIRALGAKGRKAMGSMSLPSGAGAEELLASIPEPDRSYFVKELTQPFALEESFETAIASSRLGVFATGFHFGWRGIAFLSLCSGIPMLIDRPVFLPYFDLKEFKLWENEETEWNQLETLLDSIDEETWLATKQHNQAVFDRRLAPKPMAREFLRVVEGLFD